MTEANNIKAQISEASTNAKPDNISRLIGLLAILAPTFYLIGDSYYEGFLAVAGVSKASFPLSIQNTYLHGFYGFGMIFVAIAKIIMDFVIDLSLLNILFAFIFCLLFAYLASKFKNILITSKIVSITKSKLKKLYQYLHWKNNHFSKALSVTAVGSYIVAFVLYLPVYIIALWWGLPTASYYAGKNVNGKVLAEFRTHGCQFDEKTGWSNCHTLKSKDGKVIHKGYLVAQNNVRVAFLTNDGTNILTIPKDAALSRQWQEVKSTKPENDQSTSAQDK